MTSGVYKLTFGNKTYIGRSQNIEQRFRSHISDMKNGKSSKKLLKAYLEYGEPELVIIEEETDLKKQKALEISYIKECDTLTNGLNTTEGGEDITYGELNSASKYSNKQIYEVLKLLAYSKEMTLLEISEKCDVSINVVKDISAGTKHLWLSTEYALEYALMLENKVYRQNRSLSNLTDKHQFKSNLAEYPKLLSPTGEIVIITTTLSKFASDNQLQVGNLSSLLHGRRKSHKGWALAGDIS